MNKMVQVMPLSKKFLIVIPTDSLGGAEQLQLTLAKTWIKKGDDVKVVCLTQKEHKGWVSIDEHVIYLPTENTYKGLFKLIGFLSKKSYYLVFSSQVYINGILGFLKRFKLLKSNFLVVRESTSVFSRFKGFKKFGYNLFYRLGYSATDLVIFQTDVMKSQLEENLSVAKKWHSIVLENPLDLKTITNLSSKALEIPKKGKYILGLGRLIKLKGFDLLIKAFFEVHKKYPTLKLVILGEGEERKPLENLIVSLGLKEKIDMPGFVENPFPYLKNAEVCVVSSRIEGFPNTLLQMLALNDKVITTRCAGGIDNVPYVTKIPTNNVELMVKAIIENLESTVSSEEQRIDYLKTRSLKNYLNQIENKIK